MSGSGDQIGSRTRPYTRLVSSAGGAERRSGVVLPIGLLATATALWIALGPALLAWQGIDARVYLYGGGRVLAGEPVYLGGATYPGSTAVSLFTYPPFAALLFSPLAALPTRLGVALLLVAEVTALVLSVGILLREVARRRGVNEPSRAVTLWVATGALLLYPIVKSLALTQMDLLLLPLVLYDALTPGPRRCRGVLVGLCAAVKLTPAAFALVFLVRGDWRSVARAAGTFVGASALGWLVLPRDSVTYWTQALWDTSRVGPQSYVDNRSWSGVLARLGSDDRGLLMGPTKAAWLAIAVAIALATVSIAWALTQRAEPLLALVTVAVGTLVSAPITWTHHWVWLLPSLVALADLVRRTGCHFARILIGLGVVVFLVPTSWLSGSYHPGWTLLQHLMGAAIPIWGTVTLGYLSVLVRRLPLPPTQT